MEILIAAGIAFALAGVWWALWDRSDRTRSDMIGPDRQAPGFPRPPRGNAGIESPRSFRFGGGSSRNSQPSGAKRSVLVPVSIAGTLVVAISLFAFMMILRTPTIAPTPAQGTRAPEATADGARRTTDKPESSPAAPLPRAAEPARARANLGTYISDNDYPASALRDEEQGTTGFRLTIGPDGRVTNCTITSSSGSAALDTTTCRIMRSRAHFTPARDSNGQPTTDTQSARITWRIELFSFPREP